MASNEQNPVRTFDTGATRNSDQTKIDPEGFLSWRPLDAYFEYMRKNRSLPDGSVRESDNWQLGIPQKAYMKSLWRHFFAFWKLHRQGGNAQEEPSPYQNTQLIEDGLAVMFNIMGYLDVELQKPKKTLESILAQKVVQTQAPSAHQSGQPLPADVLNTIGGLFSRF